MTSLFHRFDLNLLRIFDLLMRERSVSRVARQLHLSQSTISHSLARLREGLGDPLFVSTRSGMLPTPRAQAMAQQIRESMQLLEQSLEREPDFEPETSQRVFRIAAGSYFELIVLPSLLTRLAEVAPGVRLDVSEMSASDYEHELERHHVDLVIGFEQPVHLSDKLSSCPFLTEQLEILSASQLADREDERSLEHLRERAFIYPSPWGHSQVIMDDWCRQRGIERNVGIRVPGFIAVPPLLQAGDWLVALPAAVARYFARYYGFHTHTLPDNPPWFRHILAWHPVQAGDKGLQWLRNQLLAVAEELAMTVS